MFVAETLVRCDADAPEALDVPRMFGAYNDWVAESNRRGLNRTNLNRRLGSLGYLTKKVRKRGNRRYWPLQTAVARSALEAGLH